MVDLTHRVCNTVRVGRKVGMYCSAVGAVAVLGVTVLLPFVTPEPADRPGRAAVRAASDHAQSLQLQKCIGSPSQTFSFRSDGRSISSSDLCFDINFYRSELGSKVWAYPCGGENSRDNEHWRIKGDTIRSLQESTDACLGVSGDTAGSSTVLVRCSDTAAQFDIGMRTFGPPAKGDPKHTNYPPAKGDVKLTSYPKGRIILYDGERWGTVCGHWYRHMDNLHDMRMDMYMDRNITGVWAVVWICVCTLVSIVWTCSRTDTCMDKCDGRCLGDM